MKNYGKIGISSSKDRKISASDSPFALPLLIIVIINYRCSQSLQMSV